MFRLYIQEPLSLFVLACAVAADFIFGDKDFALHPIRIMGAAISWAEKRARALMWSEFNAGLFMALVLTTFTFLVVYLLGAFFLTAFPPMYYGFCGLCIYFSLCLKCLAEEAFSVLEALTQKDLPLARKRLSMLVSRQTKDMDETEISRAVIETVSENFVDGICSPYTYAVIGGPALCLCFKMISTLDSMIGYTNDRYERFGKAAAKMDDAANFIPARLSLFIIALSGLLYGKRRPALTIKGALRDAGFSKSPNSGLPEAAFAHVLGISLGGPAVYNGVVNDLPLINGDARPPGPDDIREAVRLLYLSSLVLYAVPFILLCF